MGRFKNVVFKNGKRSFVTGEDNAQKTETINQFLGIDEGDWLSNPDIHVFDKDGNELTDPELISRKMYREQIYIFTPDNGPNPYSAEMSDDGEILFSERPLSPDDIIDPKGELLKNDFTDYYEYETDISSEDSPEEQLNVNDIKIESKKDIVLPTTILGKPINTDGPLPDKPSTYFVSPAPAPLGALSSFWDSFVKLFNGKGSAAGQAYRTAVAARNIELEKYKEAKTEYNRVYNEKLRRDQQTQERNHRVATADEAKKEDVIKNIEKEDKATIKNAETAKHLKRRTAFAKNHFAGLLDIQQNGFTIDNLPGYETELLKKLEGEPITSENKETLAEYMVVKTINEKINSHIADPKADYRNYESMIADLNNSAKRADMIGQMFRSDQFKQVVNKFENEFKKDDFEKLLGAMDKAEKKDKFVNVIKDEREQLISQIGNQEIGEKTEDLLVRICLADKSLKRIDKMFKVAADESSRSLVIKDEMQKITCDFEAQKRIYDDILKEHPEFEERKNVAQISNEKITPELLLEDKFKTAYNRITLYENTLKSNPAIKEVCEKFKGQKFPGQAIVSLFYGTQKKMEQEAVQKKLGVKE